MSVFTSRVTRVLAIPHDPEHSVTIRKLAPKHLDAAARASQVKSIEDFRAIGGAQLMKEIESLGGEKAAKAEAAADPLVGFDRVVLMQSGITGWTYDTERTAETLADLDDQTQAFIAGEILKLSKPALYQSAEESRAATKND